MTTLYLTHPSFTDHLVPPGHPERPDRIRAVWGALDGADFAALHRAEAPLGSVDVVKLVHPADFVESIERERPNAGLVQLDGDTYLGPGSWNVALRAVGAVTAGIDAVVDGTAANVFCGVRPPGHHAEPSRSMGFCLFNQVAAGARYAQRTHGLERVAIVDFDVHHGNGTQAIFWKDPTVLYASTHQMPLYPGSGARHETGAGNIFNAPLKPGDGGAQFREAIEQVVVPALDAFRPDLVLLSAGFDAHERDPLAGLNFVAADFAWVTKVMMAVADRHCGGRLVSVLEGGYDLRGLAESTAAHVRTLMHG